MLLSDLQPEDRIFALFKGDPKTGKDIAAHSFAIAGPLYTFDLDARMESVKQYYTNTVPRPDIVNNIEYDRFTDFFSIHRRLEELKEYCHYKTVVMSSLTSLARKAMNTMLSTRSPTDKNKTKDRGGIVMHIVEDFGGEANAIMMTLDLLLAISLKHKVNVILTAHIITPELGAFRPMRVLLTGGKKIAAEVPVSFNEAYHFFVETSGGIVVNDPDATRRYLVYTKTVGTDWASTALPLPDKIDFTNRLLYEEIVKFTNSQNAPLTRAEL